MRDSRLSSSIPPPTNAGGALRYCDALRLRGVLCKDTHDHTIRVSPPLVITRDEIDWALDQFEAALTHREVAAPARPNASSRPARRLRSADLCLHVGKRGVSSTRGANGNLPQRQFYYFCAAADFTLIWSPAALATVQPFYPLQFLWSRFYRPSLGCFRVARARRHAISPRVPADKSFRSPPCARTSQDSFYFRSCFHTWRRRPLLGQWQ
jgi:hypothetical protein